MENSPPVFISHSSQDKVVANTICAALEADGSLCWIAPRNIPFGTDWSQAIVEAIAACRVMILLFSGNANDSPQVRREVQRAFEHDVPVIPVRVEDVLPHPALEYYISSVHWLNATEGLLPIHLEQLTAHIRKLLRGNAPAPAAVPAPYPAAPAVSSPPPAAPAAAPLYPPAPGAPALGGGGAAANPYAPSAAASPVPVAPPVQQYAPPAQQYAPPAQQYVAPAAQQAAPVAAPDSAPAASAAPPPNNLPEPATSFIGREQEIEDLTALLQDPRHRLITITGPGGTGKTRLSLQVASQCLAQYAHGVWMVELESVSRAQDVPAAVALAIGIPLSSEGEAKAQILAYLRERNCLLVMDNFEQVVEAARFISDLLKQCPRVAVLISSRELLQVAGEQDYPLAPLELPAANVDLKTWTQYASLRLFVERCQSAKPNFAVTESNVGDIGEICRRLEGLPLALELTSALVRGMTPQQLMPRLQDRLRLLASSRRDLDPRQRSMRGAIDWSYDLLTEDERALFAELSTFVGGFSLEAAETVCETPMVFDLVFALRDKSLLRSLEIEGESRFVMMETLREYAAEKRAEAGDQGLNARHAAYYLEQAQQWSEQLEGSGDAVLAQQRLRADIDNMRCGMDWAVQQDDAVMVTAYGRALARFFLARGLYDEGDQRLATAEEACRHSGDNKTLALLLLQRGRVAFRLSRLSDAKRLYEESYALSKQAEDTPRLVPPLINLGKIAWAENDFAAAKTIWEEGLALARTTEQPSYEATLLTSLGILAGLRGEFDEAAQRFEAAIVIHQHDQDENSLAYALLNASDPLIRQKKYAAAYEKLSRSRDLFTRMGRTPEIALTSVHIGHLHIEQNRLEEAEANIREGLRVAREIADAWSEMSGLTAQGRLHGRRGNLPDAFASLSEALNIAQRLGDRSQTGHIMEAAGRCWESGGDLPNAYLALRLAHHEFEAMQMPEAAELAAGLEPLRAALGAETIARLDAQFSEHDTQTLKALLQAKFCAPQN